MPPVLLLFLPILMWSFVGLLVKSATTMVSPSVVSFSRFFFGVLALGLWFLILKKKPQWDFARRWIWFGALAKALNYVTENVAIQMGYNWGNILVQPVQAIVLVLLSTWFLQEKMRSVQWVAVVLSLTGVFLVSWGGRELHDVLAGGWVIPALFLVSGVGAALHLYAQRRLMVNPNLAKPPIDSANMNLTMFTVASVLTCFPLGFSGPLVIGPVTWWAVAALVSLGVITGISFLLWGSLLKKVPLVVAGLLANTTALLTLLWSHLLTQDPIGPWVLSGTVVFAVGLVLLNLPAKTPPPEAD